MLQTFSFTSFLGYIGGILGIISFILTAYRYWLEIAPNPRIGLQTVLHPQNRDLSLNKLFFTLSIENIGKKPLKIDRALLLVEYLEDFTDILPLSHDGRVLLQIIDCDASAIDLSCPSDSLDVDESDFIWLKEQRVVYLQNLTKFQKEGGRLGNNEMIIDYGCYNALKSGYYRTSVIIMAGNQKIYTNSSITYVI